MRISFSSRYNAKEWLDLWSNRWLSLPLDLDKIDNENNAPSPSQHQLISPVRESAAWRVNLRREEGEQRGDDQSSAIWSLISRCCHSSTINFKQEQTGPNSGIQYQITHNFPAPHSIVSCTCASTFSSWSEEFTSLGDDKIREHEITREEHAKFDREDEQRGSDYDV